MEPLYPQITVCIKFQGIRKQLKRLSFLANCKNIEINKCADDAINMLGALMEKEI